MGLKNGTVVWTNHSMSKPFLSLSISVTHTHTRTHTRTHIYRFLTALDHMFINDSNKTHL
jgi:hypothetical protein